MKIKLFVGSGKSSVQAMNEIHGKGPRFLQPLLKKLSLLSMVCDGRCGTIAKANGVLDSMGFWPGTGGWLHHVELDFCPQCQKDGAMAVAIAVGRKPLGRD